MNSSHQQSVPEIILIFSGKDTANEADYTLWALDLKTDSHTETRHGITTFYLRGGPLPPDHPFLISFYFYRLGNTQNSLLVVHSS